MTEIVKTVEAPTGGEVQTETKKLFIGVPIYGLVDPHFFKCALKMVAEFSHNISFLPCIGDSLIPRSRNSITAYFLKTDCTHMLMIDSDLVFSNEQITRILSHDEAIVGGFYPKKQVGKGEFVCNTLTPIPPIREDGLQEMKYMGSGFLLVRRDVLETVIAAMGEQLSYTPDQKDGETEYDFWTTGLYNYPNGKRRYLSEDWYFCQRAMDLGFKIWGDTHIRLRHSGNVLYPLPEQEVQLYRASGGPLDLMIVPEEAEIDRRRIDAGEYDFPNFQARRILDIGAHVGMFAKWALHRWPDAVITCYEPWKENVEGLIANLNNDHRARVFKLAISDKSGPAQMFEGRNSLCRSLKYEQGRFRAVHTLDAAEMDCDFDLVKVDAEGCEVEILQRLDLSRVKALVCEFHSDEAYKASWPRMAVCGFKQIENKATPNNCRLVKFLKDS